MLTAVRSRLPAFPPVPPVSRKRRAVQLLVVLALLPATTLGPAALQADGAALDDPMRAPRPTGSGETWPLTVGR